MNASMRLPNLGFRYDSANVRAKGAPHFFILKCYTENAAPFLNPQVTFKEPKPLFGGTGVVEPSLCTRDFDPNIGVHEEDGLKKNKCLESRASDVNWFYFR